MAKLLLDWPNDGSPSASFYDYVFKEKNTLHIDHFLGKVLSDSVKLAFVSAPDLDECHACLLKGQALRKKMQAECDTLKTFIAKVSGVWVGQSVGRAGGCGGKGAGAGSGGGGFGPGWWVNLK